ncbi:MAG: hypothetical protein QOJ84_1951 [Bradyrhizobium sp.]|nr:hypothetical protein [Bradyrhizobium sp.]
MAKPPKARLGKEQGPPHPGAYGAFRIWLANHPREWSVVIAARAALRVLPLACESKRLDAIILPIFRATAIARFAAKYPNRAVVAGFAVSAASAFYAGGVYVAALAAANAAAANTYSSAADAVAAAADEAGVAPAITNDAERLYGNALTAEILVREPLWSELPPPRIGGAWQDLAEQLRAQASHWSVWIDWYDDVVAGAAGAATSEAEDAAFTDISGDLPWDDGAETVNTEIARRLQVLRGSQVFEAALPAPKSKAETIARLAELTSPQPSVTDKGKLDAIPNQPFDLPTVDDDLSTLPLRQRNLVTGILGDLPANAPKHLKDFLRSYDGELKARGVQPILGLLKDDADVIAAAVNAQHAEDEWLEPGMRKAFDRFAENHTLFVEHFPLDAEREAIYAETPLDEEQATGKKLIEPFETVAKATEEAHKAGATTDDFMAVVDKMIEFARVLSTQPTVSPPNKRGISPSDEIRILPEDRIQAVTTKKRVVLGALGFFERTYNLIGSTVTIAGFAGIAEALRPAIEMLSRFLR